MATAPPTRLSAYQERAERTIAKTAENTLLLCRYKDDKQRCVVKIAAKRERTGGQLARIRNEGLLMMNAQLRHPNLIHALEVFEDALCHVIVMPHANHGDLLERINLTCGLPEMTARVVAHQLLLGLNHLHTNGYVHSDVKLENVLIFDDDDGGGDMAAAEKGPRKLRYVLADWGYTQHLSAVVPNNVRGTVCYAAPELVTPGDPMNRKISHANDMWSFGVMIYGVLCGRLPFQRTNCLFGGDHSLVNDIRAVSYQAPQSRCTNVPLSTAATNFISALLLRNPKHRATARVLLTEHRWFNGIAGEPSNSSTTSSTTAADAPQTMVDDTVCEALSNVHILQSGSLEHATSQPMDNNCGDVFGISCCSQNSVS